MSDDPNATHSRSIGSFLCDRPFIEPYIDIDQLPWEDIKQDACLRAIVALKRAGKPIGPDPVVAFDAEPRLVMTAYQRAKTDALRAHLGRDADRPIPKWRRLISLDHGFKEVADPAQEEALQAIVERVSAVAAIVVKLHARWGGVSKKNLRKLLTLLRRLQRHRASGVAVVPPHLRKRLSRLRKESGLPLDIRQL